MCRVILKKKQHAGEHFCVTTLVKSVTLAFGNQHQLNLRLLSPNVMGHEHSYSSSTVLWNTFSSVSLFNFSFILTKLLGESLPNFNLCTSWCNAVTLQVFYLHDHITTSLSAVNTLWTSVLQTEGREKCAGFSPPQPTRVFSLHTWQLNSGSAVR